MKKCSFCNSRLEFSEGDDSAKCRLCGGDKFIDETEEELRQRRKQEEKKELCCPNPLCPPQLRPRAERHCIRCGETLKEATIELWLEKCIKPMVKEDTLVIAPAIEAAWLIGLSKENALERLSKYVRSDSRQFDEAPELKALEATAPTVLPNTVAEQSSTMPGRTRAVAADAKIFQVPVVHARPSLGVVMAGLLILVLAGFYFWPKGIDQNSLKAPPTSSPTPAPTRATAQPEIAPGMTFIPGGTFVMGRERKDGGDEYESPSHSVEVKPFFIDTYEVSRQDYQKCVQSQQCPAPPDWINGSYPPGTGRRPVTGVNWDAATAYARWAGKRLPTEEEWEFAARGKKGHLYPWGDDWQQGLANANGVRNELADVGEYKGASPFKVFDMVGNAWEWTASDFRSYAVKDAKQAVVSNGEKVIRGGYWGSRAAKATTTFRTGWRVRGEADYSNTGFRCALDAPQNPTR
jgi:formylglycine-generating enzyme required for sulfatase activity